MPSGRSRQSELRLLCATKAMTNLVLALCLIAMADSFLMVPSRSMPLAHALTFSGGSPSSGGSRGAGGGSAASQGFFRSLGGRNDVLGKSRGTGERCVTTAVGAESAIGDLDVILGANKGVLSDEQARMAATLVELGQTHLFEEWPEAGSKDGEKRRLLDQAIVLDSKYPGGLEAYINKARQLLKEASQGVNPFEGYTPRLADGESLVFGTEKFEDMEAKGLEAAAKTAFVLVAGGLGERLGYDGIKLALPVEVTTRQRYLELYCRHILALQAKCRRLPGVAKDLMLPLVIMTSEDTDAKTREMLDREGRFGMAKGQIIILMQDKVPALGDSSARLVLSGKDPFTLETKPHGHGDVHHLLFREGVAEDLLRWGFEWLVFFQDTNALVLNSMLPALGVSSTKGYDMNSICVPRKAKEAAGAITALTREDGSSLIINVEYNQLDPMLRATSSPEGDVNDPDTGLSPFPGNTNNIVFRLDPYVKVLKGEDKGVVVEFVNPKYKDSSSRMEFKKPTRLECMMQDFPKLMDKELGASSKIGFTSFDKWLTFSPAKNDLESAANIGEAVPPSTASSAEFDFYTQAVRRLQTLSMCAFGEPELVEFGGVNLSMGPRVVMLPSFATTSADLRQKAGPGVRVSSRSTLVLEGEGITLQSLDLDGTLIIRVAEGVRLLVRDLKLSNEGWAMVPLPDDVSGVSEEDRWRSGPRLHHKTCRIIPPDGPFTHDRVRGYLVDKRATKVIEVTQPGYWIASGEGELLKDR